MKVWEAEPLPEELREKVLAADQVPVAGSCRSNFQTPERLSAAVRAVPEAVRVGAVASIFTVSLTVEESLPFAVLTAW